MHPVNRHRWDLSPDQAVALQRELATRLIIRDELPDRLQLVGGVDVAYREDKSLAVAAAVVLDAETLQVRELVHAHVQISFPYIPGLLSFREIPAIESALGKLTLTPDVLLCDGHGIAHPRRFGLAAHVGFLFDLPTVGCAKSSLRLRAPHEPGPARGAFSELVSRGQVVGVVLRTRDRVRPLYVSPGHRVSVTTARNLVLRMCTRYRLPEPTRLADQAVSELRKSVDQDPRDL
ncbi:MAG: deoxyribonuclease V [Verrucomicrobia bacterium]|nr:deoxyribonuclease V [Verrucomicrobiota bacterium]